jgi:hypothetical protein
MIVTKDNSSEWKVNLTNNSEWKHDWIFWMDSVFEWTDSYLDALDNWMNG